MSSTKSRCQVNGDCHKILLRHLVEQQRDGVVSERFSLLETNAERVEFVYGLLEECAGFPEIVEDVKSAAKATEFREKGNEFYKNKDVSRAIEYYTKSAGCAEENSEELSLAFANRSAALFEKGMYQECLTDIARALEGNCPEKSKAKLLARQEKSTALKSNQPSRSHHQPLPEIPNHKTNDTIQCATNSIEIRYTENLGRHVVAVKNIEIGEILAIEKPFGFILTTHYLTHCHECLMLCYNLLPCNGCSETYYCSERCLEKARKYHKYECKILKTVRCFNFDKMVILPMKVALIARDFDKEFGKQEIRDKMFRSDRYWEIHNLIANTKDRTVADLFKRSTYAAVLFHLFKTYSDFFTNDFEERFFKESMLLHMQTAPCNFHSISEIRKNEEGIYEPQDIGAGAYAFLSMFNHSCNPNVVRQCFGPVIVLRAIRTIKAEEQCFDNYGHHHAVMPKSERQYHLKQQYFFDCSCEACYENWPLYQNLPSINRDIHIDNCDMIKLMEGDLNCAQKLLSKLMPEVKKLEQEMPNKNFAEKQEIIKQCFALLGNRKDDTGISGAL